MAGVMMFSLAGCGEIKKAESSVNGMFAAFKSANFEEARQYVDVDKITASEAESEITPDGEEMMKLIFKNLNYKIISSEKKDKETVIVKTEITTTDMKPVMGDFFVKAMQYAFSTAFSEPQPSEEETNKKMLEMFNESMAKDDLATVTNEIDITVKKVEKSWKVQTEDKFTDALLGGLVSATKELSESFNTAE